MERIYLFLFLALGIPCALLIWTARRTKMAAATQRKYRPADSIVPIRLELMTYFVALNQKEPWRLADDLSEVYYRPNSSQDSGWLYFENLLQSVPAIVIDAFARDHLRDFEEHLEAWFFRFCSVVVLAILIVAGLPETFRTSLWTSLPWLYGFLEGSSAIVIFGGISKRGLAWLHATTAWEIWLDRWVADSNAPAAFKRFWLRFVAEKNQFDDRNRAATERHDIWRYEPTRARLNAWLWIALGYPYLMPELLSRFSGLSIRQLPNQFIVRLYWAALVMSIMYLGWWFVHSAKTLFATWVGRYFSVACAVVVTDEIFGSKFWNNLVRAVGGVFHVVAPNIGDGGEWVLWSLAVYMIFCISRNWLGRCVYACRNDRAVAGERGSIT